MSDQINRCIYFDKETNQKIDEIMKLLKANTDEKKFGLGKFFKPYVINQHKKLIKGGNKK